VARELDALVRLHRKLACIISHNDTEFTSRAILQWASKNKVGGITSIPESPNRTAS
jgi:putative transposase